MSTTTATPAHAHAAHFATRWSQPNIAVITAHGEIDAANSPELVDYALRNGDRIHRLVLDMTGVEFFDTSGFSALHTLDVRCAAASITWAAVPSPAVSRLLWICDPDSTLPFFDRVDTALSAVHRERRHLLQLVPKTR